MVAAITPMPTRAARIPAPAPVPGNADADIHIGGRAVLDRAAELIGSATESVDAEMFRPSFEPVLDGLKDAARRGADVRLLVDSRVVEDDPLPKGLRKRADITEYGEKPLKQHSKNVVIDDGRAALVGTDVSDSTSLDRAEVGAELRGDAARAVAELARQTRSGDPEGLRDALAGAAKFGVHANDHRVGWTGLTSALNGVMAGAGQRLDLATKIVADPESVGGAIDAARRGVATRVIAHEVAPDARAALEAAGVEVLISDKDAAWKRGDAMHGTMIRADDRAAFTTAYLEDSLLNGSRGRRSREVGMVLDAQPAQQVGSAIDGILAHAGRGRG